MRVVISDIPAQGRQVSFALADAWAADAVAEAAEGTVEALAGSVDVRRKGDDARVHAVLDTRVQVPCARCGADVSLHLVTDDHLVYQPAESQDATGEVELAPEDLDVGFYDDGALSLDAVLSEVIVLALPARVTCADEGCATRAGLVEPASDDAVGHPAFAALKDLF